jgi:hypothetical protein
MGNNTWPWTDFRNEKLKIFTNAEILRSWWQRHFYKLLIGIIKFMLLNM